MEQEKETLSAPDPAIEVTGTSRAGTSRAPTAAPSHIDGGEGGLAQAPESEMKVM